MDLLGFQKTLDLGGGPLKTYTVMAGQSAAVGIDVTDGDSKYAVAFSVVSTAGIGNPANTLAYQADASWTDRSSYYTTPISEVNQSWNFNLGVDLSTPPDVYLVEMQTAGKNGGLWGEAERFYVEVEGLPLMPPDLVNLAISNNQLTVSVLTEDQVDYFLELRTSLGMGSWTNVSQVAGDGTLRSLTDPNPPLARGYYRLRAARP